MVPALSATVLEKIKMMMPSWWVPGNPIDLVAGMNFHVVMPIIETIMQSGEIDAVLLLFIGPPRNKDHARLVRNKPAEQLSKMWESMGKMYQFFYDALCQRMIATKIPIYVVSNFGPGGENEFSPALIPADRRMTFFPAIETACLAIRAMAGYYRFQRRD
jgi:hypothetical protein